MTIRELHLHLSEIINTMSEGLFCAGPDGAILLANDALTRITGYSREELLGSSCAILGCDACERSRAEGHTHHCRLFHQGLENRKNCHMRRKDGSLAHVIKNASLLRDASGGVIGAVETVMDITELDVKERRIQTLSRNLDEGADFYGMVGRSAAMRGVFNLLEKAAAIEAPVLILGESGSGKELAARAIHELGPRSEGPYVAVNCAALNQSLLESELFGHAKGAFTGAYRHREGRFEEARGGDLFLDEIGDAPLAVQVKLLRVLETRSFERVGDSRPLVLDARLILATNQDLPELVAQKRFREDFYYRVNVLPIRLPSLRERREDIPLLAARFVETLRRRTGKDVPGLTAEAMALLANHAWPGNVRELKSALDYAFMLIERGPISPAHLPPHLAGSPLCPPSPPSPPSAASETPFAAPVAEKSGEKDRNEEKQALLDALAATDGNQSAAARLLGVSRLTVLNRMRKYGIRKVLSS